MSYLGEVPSVLVTVLVVMLLARSVAALFARSAPNSLQGRLAAAAIRVSPSPTGCFRLLQGVLADGPVWPHPVERLRIIGLVPTGVAGCADEAVGQPFGLVPKD